MMMKVMVFNKEVNRALTVFHTAYGGSWLKTKEAFKKLLHIENLQFGRHLYLMPLEDANRIRLMNGIHGYTICKILIAKELL